MKDMDIKMPTKLWDKNFTIITLGTIVSMLGNALSGFAISLMVLDYNQSTFLYTLFIVAYNVPKVVMPLIAGPYLDNFSRRKVIYTLDFISCALYLSFFFVIKFDFINFPLFLILAIVIGSIDSIYQVAYDSLYPLLVAKENYKRAYSISSMIYPLSSVMVPVAAIIYDVYGTIEPIFLANAATFLIAAVMETQIKIDESYIRNNEKTETKGLRKYFEDFRFGLDYIKSEKGLLFITVYFFITMFCGGGSLLIMPYFKSTEGLNVTLYTVVMGAAVVGRMIGGLVHYKLKFPAKKKYLIAIVVYLTISVIEGTYLFTPVWAMTFLMFISGMFSVTSYNIRITGTQTYVPETVRGRFNGCFSTVTTLGTITGQLLAGALAEVIQVRIVILSFMALNAVSVLAVMLPGKKHVEKVYNVNI